MTVPLPPPNHAVTTAELAAYLGVTPSAVRQTIRRHHIPPLGKRGRAPLYDAHRILDITGRHDRRAPLDEQG